MFTASWTDTTCPLRTTQRQGSPYTLVLSKTKGLFPRDAKLRETQRRELAWLTRQQRNFVGPTARKRS